MTKKTSKLWNGVLKRLIYALLRLSKLQFAVTLCLVAVVVSVMIVMTIDFFWDGRFNTELEFAGVVTPFLDALFIVIFVNAMFDVIREEVTQRKVAEEALRNLNEELKNKINEHMRQLQEVNQLQEELVRTEKLALLGQVADTVGHELRNPLGVMNNAIYFLQSVLTDVDDTTREYLGIIQEEIVDAERIVSDLLDAVRTRPPQPQMVDVAVLLEQALGKCEVPLAVSVRKDIPERLPTILADPGQMRQVFRNLIANGVEAMPDGGILDIRAEADQAAKTVTIGIKDSGSGISPENMAGLFQPMFTTKVRRVGLGLTVVKNLTQVNGGSVGVESVDGEGSRFIVTLPSGGGDRGVIHHAIADKEKIEEVS